MSVPTRNIAAGVAATLAVVVLGPLGWMIAAGIVTVLLVDDSWRDKNHDLANALKAERRRNQLLERERDDLYDACLRAQGEAIGVDLFERSN